MLKLAYELLKEALIVGIKESDYWDMTFAEVNRVIEAYNSKLTEDFKREAQSKYDFTMLLATAIGATFSKESVHIPTLDEMYPTLFKPEITEEEKQQRDTDLSVAHFIEFATNFNKTHKKE